MMRLLLHEEVTREIAIERAEGEGPAVDQLNRYRIAAGVDHDQAQTQPRPTAVDQGRDRRETGPVGDKAARQPDQHPGARRSAEGHPTELNDPAHLLAANPVY